MSRGAWIICTVREWSTGILKGYALSLKVGALTFSTEFICQANILVDQACHARLADFGFLTTITDSSLNSSTSDRGGTTRWMSPELLQGEIQDCPLTELSDRYALGMVIYEVLSGHIPFHEYRTFSIAVKVIRGDRPERPQGVEGGWFAGGVWEILGRCWAVEPEDRSNAKDVLQCLKEVSGSWIPPPPSTNSPTSSTFESSGSGLESV
jgi:serine/threonine protein kinase